MPDIMQMGKGSNYLGSWDLYDSPNQKIQVTIAKVQDEEVINQGKKETATVCYFVERQYKPMILNVTNKKTLAKLFKTTRSENYIGKRIEIGYEKVKAFGKISDALRITMTQVSQQPVQQAAPKCESCGNDIKPAGNMTAEQTAWYTKQKYGKQLCSVCATKLAQEGKQNGD